VDIQRRNWLRGRLSAKHIPLLPPWSISYDLFVEQCTRCHACIESCPEQIIVKGESNYPNLDFTRGECTFCTQCANACPEGLFTDTGRDQAWFYKAQIDEHCVTQSGVMCQTCRDHCETGAITFRPRLGQVAQPSIETENCNGCGACVKNCPVSAISVHEPKHHAAQESAHASS